MPYIPPHAREKQVDVPRRPLPGKPKNQDPMTMDISEIGSCRLETILQWLANNRPPKPEMSETELFDVYRLILNKSSVQGLEKMRERNYPWTSYVTALCCALGSSAIVDWVTEQESLPIDVTSLEQIALRGSLMKFNQVLQRLLTSDSTLMSEQLVTNHDVVRNVCANVNHNNNFISEYFNAYPTAKTQLNENMGTIIARYQPLLLVKWFMRESDTTQVTPLMVIGASMGCKTETLKWFYSQIYNNKTTRPLLMSEYFVTECLGWASHGTSSDAIPCMEYLFSIGVKPDINTLNMAMMVMEPNIVNMEWLLANGAEPSGLMWLKAIKSNNILLLKWMLAKKIPFMDIMDEFAREYANYKTIDWLQNNDLIA